MSQTIAFINGKGGVGKTTVSLLIALALQQVRRDVVVLDCDPQKSATTFAENMGLRVVEELPAAGPVVIIDTPPTLRDPETLHTVHTADLVVLITTPSPTDVGATAATADVIRRERAGPTLILFNRIQASNRFANTLQAIAARLPYPALQRVLYQRTAYQVAQLEGWSALPALARVELAQVALELFSFTGEMPHVGTVAPLHPAEMAPLHVAAMAPLHHDNVAHQHVGTIAPVL